MEPNEKVSTVKKDQPVDADTVTTTAPTVDATSDTKQGSQRLPYEESDVTDTARDEDDFSIEDYRSRYTQPYPEREKPFVPFWLQLGLLIVFVVGLILGVPYLVNNSENKDRAELIATQNADIARWEAERLAVQEGVAATLLRQYDAVDPLGVTDLPSYLGGSDRVTIRIGGGDAQGCDVHVGQTPQNVVMFCGNTEARRVTQ